MGRCRFVQPSVVRLPLSDGDYLDVKKELTAYEQRRIFSQLVTTMHAGEKTVLDPAKVGKTKILEYVVGWSLLGADGSPEPFSEAALDALDIETYREIEQAVDAHDVANEQAREARKKKTAGTPDSDPTSASLSAATGPLPTSVN